MFVDGENLADMLIEAGMAVRYDGGKKTHKWCEDLRWSFGEEYLLVQLSLCWLYTLCGNSNVHLEN